MRARHFVALVFAMALLVGSCTTSVDTTQWDLVDVEGIEDVTDLFNEGVGSPRLILLLSPG